MHRFLRILATASAAAAIALMAAGCEEDPGGGVSGPEMTLCCKTARGGGSIVITDPGGASHKATFGFQLVCAQSDDPAAPRVSGQFEYQDHRPWKKSGGTKAQSVSLHGEATDVPLVEVGVCTATHAEFTGTYRPQPGNVGPGGNFLVKVDDLGKPGPSDGDTFSIELIGGVFDGYKTNGVLAGGNIKTS